MQNQINTVDEALRHNFQEIDKDNRRINHYVSSGSANRYGQILPIEGFDETGFRKNNVVLFQHGTSDTIVTTPAKDQLDFIIGKNLLFTKKNNYLMASTQFRKEGQSQVADDVYNMNTEGFLNAWSKYWYPIPSFDNVQQNKDGTITVDKWGMYEYSSVIVPVDENAVNNLEITKNMLSVAKSDLMKNFLSKQAVENKIDKSITFGGDPNGFIAGSDPLDDLKDELAEIKKNSLTIEQVNEQTLKILKQYNSKLRNTLLEIVGDTVAQSLNQSINNLDSIIDNKVVGAIRKVTGRL